MSRAEEYSPKDDPRADHNAPAVDRGAEIAARTGLSREAAHAEMDRFRGVAEYEIRKLFGQRSALHHPVAPAVDTKTGKRKKTAAARIKPIRPKTDSDDELPNPAEHPFSGKEPAPEQAELFDESKG